MPSNTMYQSFQGPTDTSLRMGPVEGQACLRNQTRSLPPLPCAMLSQSDLLSCISLLRRYTQVSRVGEQVQNCFVDGYEYGTLADTFTDKEIKGEVYSDGKGKFKNADDDTEYRAEPRPVVIEYRPHFYEWATATVGMIALARRQRSTFRNYVAAEAAAPVMVCAALKGPLDETDWMFAGIVRSNCVRTSAEPKFDPTTSWLIVLAPATFSYLSPTQTSHDRALFLFLQWMTPSAPPPTNTLPSPSAARRPSSTTAMKSCMSATRWPGRSTPRTTRRPRSSASARARRAASACASLPTVSSKD
jgi:hypothetical protein